MHKNLILIIIANKNLEAKYRIYGNFIYSKRFRKRVYCITYKQGHITIHVASSIPMIGSQICADAKILSFQLDQKFHLKIVETFTETFFGWKFIDALKVRLELLKNASAIRNMTMA